MGLSIQIAGGTVAGRRHNIAGDNNQDAFCWGQAQAGLVGVVCDGCGSGKHSEVGAKLAARWTVRAIGARLGRGQPIPDLLEEVRQELLSRMYQTAVDLGADPGPGWSEETRAEFGQTVKDYLLFTIVGIIVEGARVTTFALGDGLVVVNRQRHRLGPFPRNEPPFLGYALMPSRAGAADDRFVILDSLPIQALRSILIGTDGAAQIDERADDLLPSGQERVGSLDQFWTDDHIFGKREALSRRLAMIQRGPSGGILGDDVAIVVVRKV